MARLGLSLTIALVGAWYSIKYTTQLQNPSLAKGYEDVQAVLTLVHNSDGFREMISVIDVSNPRYMWVRHSLQTLYGLSVQDAKLVTQYVVHTGWLPPHVLEYPEALAVGSLDPADISRQDMLDELPSPPRGVVGETSSSQLTRRI